MHGPDQDANRFILSLDSLDQVDAIARLEGDVDHRHIRLDQFNEAERIFFIVGFATACQVPGTGEPNNQGFPYGRMVVDNQDAYRPGPINSFRHEDLRAAGNR